MVLATPRRHTIGYVSSWHVYEGASVEPYSFSLIRGMRAAAHDLNCTLLLACGVGPIARIHSGAPAWPFPEDGDYFVPVGPDNVDGLIVLPTELNSEQSAYLQNLRSVGYPIVFAGPGERGPSVILDNTGGIRQAVEHLVGHGHRQIAFISGLERTSGDSAQRRQAFSQALRAFNLVEDQRLVARGGHSFLGGQQAMQAIIQCGAPFSAVVSSNDRSAMGAISALNAAGRRVPDDVAVIGFDDIPEAGAWSPPLTTLRNASFEKGYQAVVRLVYEIEGRPGRPRTMMIPSPLVIRRSCGCDSLHRQAVFSHPQALKDKASEVHKSLEQEVLSALDAEMHSISREEAANLTHKLVQCFLESLARGDRLPFHRAVDEVLARTEALDEDLYVWNCAWPILLGYSTESVLVSQMVEELHLEVIERSRRQTVRRQLKQSEAADLLSMMSSQLLLAMDQLQIKKVFNEYLGQVGIHRLMVVFMRPDESGPAALSEIFLSFGFAHDRSGEQFPTWQFPPPGWLSPSEHSCVALLPLNIPQHVRGYVAVETENLEPLAVIVRSLESALRASFLYADAVQGRRMAEEADLLKSRFLSMVSHELRTPLNLIGGLSGILLRQKGQPPDANLWQDLERIYANSQHLGRLIGDVLDLVSSETGHLRLLYEPLDLAEVLRPVLFTGEQMAREKGLAWKVDLPEHGPYVMGDRTRLRQVVLNLISNAVKFTFQGEISLVVQTTGLEVTIAVSDTGIGVRKQDQDLIFGEFGRSELVIRQGISGIGLGLAITRELVERQGGKIGVLSTGVEGEGSTFYVTLPVIDWMDETLEPDTPVNGLLDNQKPVALLVSQSTRGDTLVDRLRASGFKVDVYTLEAEAQWLVKLLAAPPCAVLMDEMLSTSQGWDILAALKRHPATAYLPVLVCRSAEAEHTGAVLELDYQMKPLDLQQITRILKVREVSSDAPTILVVDDDAVIRDLHIRLVRQRLSSCHVVEAEDGQQALDLMRQVRPDLVLLDLMMPGVDGFSVLDQMYNEEGMRDVPVIVLTAKVLTEEDMQRLNQGVAAILSKGVLNTDEIIARINTVLSKDRTLSISAQRLVRRAVAYIQAHYAEALTRDQIARHINISADHLSDCFHQEMGIAPIAYLIRYRIYRACQLLDLGGHNITEVALEVGFSEAANFSRAFQREMGVSPRAYQRQRQNARLPGK